MPLYFDFLPFTLSLSLEMMLMMILVAFIYCRCTSDSGSIFPSACVPISAILCANSRFTSLCILKCHYRIIPNVRHNVYAIDSTFTNTSLSFANLIRCRALFACKRTLFSFSVRFCYYRSLRWRRVFDIRIYLRLIRRDSILIEFVLLRVLLTWFFLSRALILGTAIHMCADCEFCAIYSAVCWFRHITALRWFVWFVKTALTLMSVRVSWMFKQQSLISK